MENEEKQKEAAQHVTKAIAELKAAAIYCLELDAYAPLTRVSQVLVGLQEMLVPEKTDA